MGKKRIGFCGGAFTVMDVAGAPKIGHGISRATDALACGAREAGRRTGAEAAATDPVVPARSVLTKSDVKALIYSVSSRSHFRLAVHATQEAVLEVELSVVHSDEERRSLVEQGRSPRECALSTV